MVEYLILVKAIKFWFIFSIISMKIWIKILPCSMGCSSTLCSSFHQICQRFHAYLTRVVNNLKAYTSWKSIKITFGCRRVQIQESNVDPRYLKKRNLSTKEQYSYSWMNYETSWAAGLATATQMFVEIICCVIKKLYPQISPSMLEKIPQLINVIGTFAINFITS